MSSPKVFVEEQLARKAELIQRIEMMRNYLAGKSEEAVGSTENYDDTTEQEIMRHEEEIAAIDASIARLRDGAPRTD